MKPIPDSRLSGAGCRILGGAAVAVSMAASAAGTLPPGAGNSPAGPASPPSVRAPSTTPRPPVVVFSDVTREAAIDFSHVTGAAGDRLLPETMGGGVAFLDYDNDGDPDLLFVNSRYWPAHEPDNSPEPVMGLYRNDGTGRFENVTRGSGLDISLYGMGVAVGDYDNDGWVDVFVTALGENRLLQNRRGIFHDVSAGAGVAGGEGEWSTSAAFIDYDNDGNLDLFVANYMRWSREIDLELGRRFRFIMVAGKRAYASPNFFKGAHPYLYRNNGDGTFTDLSAQSGMHVNRPGTGVPMAKALAVAPVDLDRDGWLDLVVANDLEQNFCYHNQGDGTYRENGLIFGLALDADGRKTSSMGIDAAYYRNDGRMAIAIGNYAREMDSFFVSREDPLRFDDVARSVGLGAATFKPLTFALFFLDYDLDGRLDFFQTNGHLEEEIQVDYSDQTYAQPAQLFWNCGSGCSTTFIEVPVSGSGDLGTPLVGRGASYADMDNDGDLDMVIAQLGGGALLLRNEQRLGHHWLRVRLVGRRVNRDAIGAWVELVAGGNTQRRQVMPSRGYLSQVELPVTFGLGRDDTVESLTVIWPDGSRQAVKSVSVDSIITVEQEP